MSIATEIQRLQTSKENIKAAIENKGVTVGDGTIDTYAEKIDEIEVGGDYDQGYEDGKNSVVPLERYANRISLIPSLFTEENLVINLDNATNLSVLWYANNAAQANKNVKHLTVNCFNPITNTEYAFSSAYANDDVLEHLTLNIDTSKITTFRRSFGNLRAVKVIDGTPIDVSICTNFTAGGSVFQNCTALEYVRFKGMIKASISFAQSANLSDDTTQHIIDELADLTDSTTQTLTLHATVGANLTDEQICTITAKNWTLAY